ncbi:esterase/lipase family protein [Streptomyces cuspidosporus]|uniref:AB hydrolase-1 domain-containing protein n=1 Tax=Streptomyces cuspidosporus TaxID=66882 RepID=A0ABN3GRE2_9ACTN
MTLAARCRALVPCAALMLLLTLLGAAPTAAAAEPRSCVGGGLQQIAEKEPVTNTMPVLFVHGINAGADTWDEPGDDPEGWFPRKVAKLRQVTAWTFDYKPAQPAWVTDPRIGPALRTAIDCLADASGHKVMVVAHSMGGLATQYAVSLPSRTSDGKAWQKVAEVITIGTPFRGSPVATGMDLLVPFPKGSVEELLMKQELSLCRGYAGGGLLDTCRLLDVLRSPQGLALKADSPQIRKLPPWPKALPVRAMAGDIRLNLELLGLGPSSGTLSLGDIVVPLSSATAYHNKSGAPYVLACVARTFMQVLFNDCNHTSVKTAPKIMSAAIDRVKTMQRKQATPDLAYATADSVNVWTNGSTKNIAPVPSGYRVRQLTWSADGTSLAWLAERRGGTGRKVFQVRRARGQPFVTPRVRSWECPDCSAIAFRDNQLVSDGASDPDSPKLWSYPPLGGARRALPVTGLPSPEECFGPTYCGRLQLLGAAPHGELTVSYFDSVGNFPGVGSFYHVSREGRARRVQSFYGSGLGPEVAAASPRRDRLAVPWYQHLSACEEYSNVAIVDQRSGRVDRPDLPSRDGNLWMVAAWFDRDGQAYAAFRSEPGCDGDDQYAPDGQRIPRWGETRVYRASNVRWVQTREKRPVLARDVHASGKTATVVGTPAVEVSGGYHTGTLVAQNAANAEVEVARGVHAFAWQPAS